MFTQFVLVVEYAYIGFLSFDRMFYIAFFQGQKSVLQKRRKKGCEIDKGQFGFESA